jgi:toxin ParE1/3/4
MAERARLFWTGPALLDLEEIRRYVSLDKPSAARQLAESIRKKVLRLKAHPLSGRKVPELAELGYREIVVAPYRIIYEVRDKSVVILRV